MKPDWSQFPPGRFWVVVHDLDSAMNALKQIISHAKESYGSEKQDEHDSI